MIINLIPQVRTDEITYEIVVQGDTITIGGATFDLSPLADGDMIGADAIGSEWIVGAVQRVGADIVLDVLYPIGPEASEAARFPEPIIAGNGLVELPDPGWPVAFEEPSE